MPKFKRRQFLQFAGSALATIGFNQGNFFKQANQYGTVLAQSTPRKLALLIGINQYDTNRASSLSGCLTDIEMQQQLLIHRFGFNPQDILVLADNANLLPTRANILQAFQEHLIDQVRPGDVVVVHYSGHGDRIQDPTPITVSQCGTEGNQGLNGTFIPRDATATAQSDTEIIVTDIMGRSLFLLMEQIDTPNLTVVLDSCFSGAGTRGNARVRAASSGSPNLISYIPSPEELENQQRWLKDLGLTEKEFQQRRAAGIAKGIAIGSASCNQLAIEQPYDSDRVAGTFTYLLTSYLWQTPGIEIANTVKMNLIRSTKISTQSRGEQVPLFEEQPGSDNLKEPFYFTNSLAPFAEGVVRTIRENQIECWLGGLSYATLKTAQPGTIYTLLDPQTGELLGDMALTSRVGLLGIGKLLEEQSVEVRPGLLIREKISAIPNPSLRIGIHPTLTQDDNDVINTLQSLLQSTDSTTGQTVSRVNILPMTPQSDIEYILARTTSEIQANLRQTGETELPPLGTIGLYSADLSSVVPQSTDAVDESPSTAINRLKPKFKTLLVARILKELAGTTTNLNIEGEIYTANRSASSIPLTNRGTLSASRSGSLASVTYQDGDVIEIKVTNLENNAVYLSCLVIDSQGEVISLHPGRWNDPDEAARINTGETLVIPRAADGIRFRVSGSGFFEVLTLVSKQPLRGLLRALQSIARGTNRSSGAISFSSSDPLTLITELLSDVDNLSRSGVTILTESISEEDTAVNSEAIAVFSNIVEIVEK